MEDRERWTSTYWWDGERWGRGELSLYWGRGKPQCSVTGERGGDGTGALLLPPPQHPGWVWVVG